MNHRSVTILLILCLMGLLSIGAMFGFHHYNAKNTPPKRHYPIFTSAEETEPEPEVPAPTPRKLAEVEARLAAPEETPEETSTQETEEPVWYQFYSEEPTTPSQPETPQETDNTNPASGTDTNNTDPTNTDNTNSTDTNNTDNSNTDNNNNNNIDNNNIDNNADNNNIDNNADDSPAPGPDSGT